MKNDRLELADVVRQFRDAHAAQFGHVMMPSQKKAIDDIAGCMTPAMGGHRYRCQDCGDEFWICHGCRNQSCPKCHGRRRQRRWPALAGGTGQVFAACASAVEDRRRAIP
jgi:predicted nucleic acid-binding Zn ribbon protein